MKVVHIVKMIYLKIIFYGILSFVERHPLFTTFLVLTAIFAPIVWKTIGWVVLGIIVLLLLVVGGMALRVHSMRRKMEGRCVVVEQVFRASMQIALMLVASTLRV